MSFVLFGLAFGVLIWLHFWTAGRAWFALQGEHPPEMDLSYVRLEDYLGRSFRHKLAYWRGMPDTGEANPYFRTIWKGNERILVSDTAHYPEEGSSQDILAMDGDFSCGPHCTFTREIYVQRNCQIGKRTRMQSVAADRDLVLGPDAVVVRWVDAHGDLELRAGSRVLSRASSATAIRLYRGARAASLYAPEISTWERSDESVEINPAMLPGSGVTLLRPDQQPAPLEAADWIPGGCAQWGWMDGSIAET